MLQIIRNNNLRKDIGNMSQIQEEADWTVNYYTELDPEKRQVILKEHMEEPSTEADAYRQRLWVARYGKRRPKQDAFVGYLMNLKYIAESGSVDLGGQKKKLAAEVIHGLDLYEIEKQSEEHKAILYAELKNACLKYIDISAKGRGFTSVLFGMGQLDDESVAKKIADQLSTVVYTAPHMLHMEKEFAFLQKAAVEAFRLVYPNREHFLKKC